MGQMLQFSSRVPLASRLGVALIGVALVGLSSCSLSSADRDPSLSVDLSALKRAGGGAAPYALHEQNSLGFLGGAGWGAFATTYQGPPSSLSGFTCYGVNVTGPGISDSSIRRQSSDPLREFERAVTESDRFCSYRGVVTPPLSLSGIGSSEATLSIPGGDIRLVQIVGVTSQEICDSGVLGQDASISPDYPRYFEIGRAVLKQVYSDRSVSIVANWPMDLGTSGDLARMRRSMECQDELPPSSVQNVFITQVALGSSFSCALSNQGEVWCWGRGMKGQLGNGESGSSEVRSPARVLTKDGGGNYSTLAGIVQLAAGEEHVCALQSAGGVYCWGNNEGGRLGDGSTTLRPYAVRVVGSESWSGTSAIAAGGTHSCAIVAGGVKCWGSNSSGQLGDESFTQRLTPVDVLISPSPAPVPFSGAIQITLGTTHSCALRDDSLVFCWGNNSSHQLGLGGAATNLNLATQVLDLSNAKQIEVGSTHSCAVTAAGEVKCWGDGSSGRLGTGSPDNTGVAQFVLSSLTDESLKDVTSVQSGGNFSCATRGSGEVFCWGNGLSGQLGNGAAQGGANPKAIQSSLLSNLGGIQLGGDHGCGILAGGQVYCWGSNNDGQSAPNLSGQSQVLSPSLISFE